VHIPDGFIAPQVVVPAYGAAGVLWAIGLRRLRRHLDPGALPRLAVVTAAAFVLMMITVPLPGGTSGHVTGIGMLAVLFGPWLTFLSLSLVFALQALLFADGGVTALPVNALAMGLVGGLTASAVFQALRRLHEPTALVAAGWCGTLAAALGVALVLGAQPRIASAPDGTPRFFPFGWDVTLPAVLLPHLLIGLGDGLITLLAYRALVGKRP
jgi:cobalt/nickel transport system permease protein